MRQSYNRALDLKIITPFMVLNYVKFLQEECSLFEESFRIFERAIELFPCFDPLKIKVKCNLRITVQKYSRVFMRLFKEILASGSGIQTCIFVGHKICPETRCLSPVMYCRDLARSTA